MASHPLRRTEALDIDGGADPFAYLSHRRALTAGAIRATLGGLGETAVATADPGLWARAYPRSTAFASFVVGATAASLLLPRRGSRPETATRTAGFTGPSTRPDGPVSPAGTTVELPNESASSKVWAAMKSVCWGAAYGLGRNMLTQVLNDVFASPAQADEATPSGDQDDSMLDEWQTRTAEVHPNG